MNKLAKDEKKVTCKIDATTTTTGTVLDCVDFEIKLGAVSFIDVDKWGLDIVSGDAN